MLLHSFTRPFAATSLSAFWRYWNPGYGFYLLYYCYQPLRRLFPHSVSVLLTFAACGACHDILFLFPAAILRGDSIPLPFMTSWFLIIGVGILVVDHLRIRFDALHSLLRVPIHAGFLFVTFYLTRSMDRLV
jgi:hypothetical protein